MSGFGTHVRLMCFETADNSFLRAHDRYLNATWLYYNQMGNLKDGHARRPQHQTPALLKNFRFTGLAILLLFLWVIAQHEPFNRITAQSWRPHLSSYNTIIEVGHTCGGYDLSSKQRAKCDTLISRLMPVIAKNDTPVSSTAMASDSCKIPLGVPIPPTMRFKTPTSYPSPALGSHTITKIDASKCMTHEQRYSSYTDKALATSYLSDYYDWLSNQQDLMSAIDDAALQLSLANEDARTKSVPPWRELMDACRRQSLGVKHEKTVVLLRVYENHTWQRDDVLNVRALLTELSLHNREHFDVRILLEVHGRNASVFSSRKHRHQVLSRSVPREFWELTEMWTEDSLLMLYPYLPGVFRNRMSAQR
jgi:hypothetical protein